MTARPPWLPREFRDEYDRLCRDMLHGQASPEALELAGVVALLKDRWTAAVQRMTERHPVAERAGSVELLTANALWDAMTTAAQAATAVRDHDSRH